jgi:hypothetical protein
MNLNDDTKLCGCCVELQTAKVFSKFILLLRVDLFYICGYTHSVSISMKFQLVGSLLFLLIKETSHHLFSLVAKQDRYKNSFSIILDIILAKERDSDNSQIVRCTPSLDFVELQCSWESNDDKSPEERGNITQPEKQNCSLYAPLFLLR